MRITHQNRIIIAGMMGNMVETFDITLCGLLSLYLAKYLVGNSTEGILIVFFTFFAGYLARPLGAVFIGLFSDMYGRKKILAASILGMGLATAAIGLIPGNDVLGRGSIALLILLRIIQSFSCGAEYINSSAYLVECTTRNKGYSGSWSSFGASFGLLLATLTTLVVANVNEAHKELEWLTWRIPFVLSLLGTSVGLYIRLCIPESLEFVLYYSDHSKPTLGELVKQSGQFIAANRIKSLLVFALSSLGVSITFLIYIYAPVQAHIYGSFNYKEVIVSSCISLTVMLCCFPLMGRLSDRITNRMNIVIAAAIGFFVLSHPFFYALSHGNYYSLIITQSLIAIPVAAYAATVPVVLSEMFPINLRCTVLSFLYSIAASLSAGLIPFLTLYLVNKTTLSTYPAWFVLILVLVVLILLNILKKKETRLIVGEQGLINPH